VQSAVLGSHVVRLSVRLSVCPSVTLVDCDHISWKSWKLIARTISPTCTWPIQKWWPIWPMTHDPLTHFHLCVIVLAEVRFKFKGRGGCAFTVPLHWTWHFDRSKYIRLTWSMDEWLIDSLIDRLIDWLILYRTTLGLFSHERALHESLVSLTDSILRTVDHSVQWQVDNLVIDWI